MSLTDGQVFAGYTIVGRLGSGGMGEVYLAQHPRLPRRDALKVLPAALTADREYRERFSREADLASELWHPHIVGIHDRGEFEGQLWLSMDYVEGTDAAHLLRGDYRRGLPRAQACRIVAAVADALDYAHQRGLLHRDVKPANILLGENDSRDRRILLADFGIARQVGDVSGLTATNMVMGTTAYAAPEQLMGHDIDGRADQYALGCTAFHLLTGAMPFENSNAAVVISQHLSAPPPRIGDRRPELADLDAAFARVLAKSPADRFDSCAAFAAALTARPASRPAPTAVAPVHTGPTREIPAASPSSPPRRRRHIAVGLGAAVTVALIAAAVLVGTGVLNRQSTDASTESTASTAPTDAAPAVRLERYITDPSGRLTPVDRSEVATALAKLEHRHHVRLWIAYVDDFDGLTPYRWAEKAMHANGFTDTDGLLAIDTTHHTVAFRAPAVMTADGAQPRVNADVIRRERILPAVKRSEWTKAALAAANGLDTTI